MDFDRLKKIAIENEVRIDNHDKYSQKPAYYYDSLRNAFKFYFNTFITKNVGYEFYITSISANRKDTLTILESQFLDAENTELCLISFARFFELFLKDILNKTNQNLTFDEQKSIKKTWELIEKIAAQEFEAKKNYTIPLRITLNRFYDLVNYSKDNSKKDNKIIKKFSKTISEFSFIEKFEYKPIFRLLNWYRDRIMHNGNKLPTLQLLDYIVTQLIIPIALNILKSDKNIPENWLYFTKTISGINILDEMSNVKFEIKNLKNDAEISETLNSLFYIGHLKELGRANMNMNNAIRENRHPYEYNSLNPKGRGARFAEIEYKLKEYTEAKKIKTCPCCNGKSLVLYEIKTNNSIIQWIKCYTCDYYLRNNMFDLHLVNPKFKKLFDY